MDSNPPQAWTLCSQKWPEACEGGEDALPCWAQSVEGDEKGANFPEIGLWKLVQGCFAGGKDFDAEFDVVIQDWSSFGMDLFAGEENCGV